MSNAADGYLGDWAPHRTTCRCTDCQLDRATTKLASLTTALHKIADHATQLPAEECRRIAREAISQSELKEGQQ